MALAPASLSASGAGEPPPSFLLPPFPLALSTGGSLGDLPTVSSSGNVGVFEAHTGLPTMQQTSFLPPQSSGSLNVLPLQGDMKYDAQQQLIDMDELFLQQQLSTPTMHPKLVSTLKSIIAPSLLSPPNQFDHWGLGFRDLAENDGPQGISQGDLCSERSIPLSERSISKGDMCFGSWMGNRTDGNRPVLDLQQMQMLNTCCNGPGDLLQAAVVPVDLIRNRRPFRCNVVGCNKTFKNHQTLKMHHKTHSSEYASSRYWTHSLATFPQFFKAGHNKKIPSKCPICKQTFVGLYELRRHFGRKHSEGEKAHACKKCGKKFYIEVDVRDHEKLCGEPLECKCGMKFAFKCNLVAHKKTHPRCQEAIEENPKGDLGAELRNNGWKAQSRTRAQAGRTSAVAFNGMSLSQISVS